MKKKAKNIPFIHNYCDRWCERCYFTNRCAVAESTGKLSPEQLDINNKAFWDNLSNNFAKAITMLHKAAEKHGFTIPETTEDEHESFLLQEELKAKRMEASPLIMQCKAYMHLADKWLDSHEQLMEKQEELIQHFDMGLRNEEESYSQLATIADCLEVIQWYLHFIHVKFMRALSGKADGEELDVENCFQKDSDGSAKIALIAAERSIQAWLQLNELLPNMEDDVLPILASLQYIQRLGNAEFPDSIKFIRPGFDE